MRPLRLKSLVVATDLQSSSLAALQSAHRLATAAGADLHVAHVIAGDPAPSQAARRSAAEALGALLDRADIPADGAAVHIIPGTPAPAIRALADRVAADALMLGPHHPGGDEVGGRPLGGSARDLVERTYVPILIAPRPLMLPIGEVLVPIDLSETARGALLVALTWASALRRRIAGDDATRVTALHVTRPASVTMGIRAAVAAELDVVRGRAGSWAGITLEGRVVEADDPARAIADQASEIGVDLLVLGTRGRHALDGTGLGSVSEAVAMSTDVPMLLVPPGVWQAFAASR